MNTYEMSLSVRDNINETSEDHWSDHQILMNLNSAHKLVWQLVSMAAGDWLVFEEAGCTPVASKYLLPYYMEKIVYVKHTASDYEIPIRGQNVRDHLISKVSTNALYGGAPDAYIMGQYLVINADNFTDNITIYYEHKVKDLIFGSAGSASGATAIELEQAMFPSMISGYYIGEYIEIMRSSGYVRDYITDYNHTSRVATISGTAAEDDNFGTVSKLPEMIHPLIVLKATTTALSKPSSAIDPKYYQMFKDEFNDQWSVAREWLTSRTPGGNRVRITEED